MTANPISDWWVGTALLQGDGAIIVKSASTQQDGTVAHLYAEYPPEHEHYEAIQRHVGLLQVGVWKPIPPFPGDGFARQLPLAR